METKNKEKVSETELRIIDISIQCLQQEGLRFSVDTLAERLKISKKTIYKYFPSKEALAYAMYERYYEALNGKINEIVLNAPPSLEELLLCYSDSVKMARKEIFNKYCLNASIEEYSLQRHGEVWNAVKPYVCEGMTEKETAVYKIIVDGAFEKAAALGIEASEMIGMLRKMK